MALTTDRRFRVVHPYEQLNGLPFVERCYKNVVIIDKHSGYGRVYTRKQYNMLRTPTREKIWTFIITSGIALAMLEALLFVSALVLRSLTN